MKTEKAVHTPKNCAACKAAWAAALEAKAAEDKKINAEDKKMNISQSRRQCPYCSYVAEPEFRWGDISGTGRTVSSHTTLADHLMIVHELKKMQSKKMAHVALVLSR